MSTLDFVVMSIFAILMVLIGLVFTVQSSKSSKSFFEAGGQTPWWINGLSLFISYFSAATFVVWGSIAYRYGLIANAIQFTMCVSGFVTALFIAGKWKRTGAATAAEYLGKRFGKQAKQYYSYMVLLYSLVSTAAVLYAVGKIVYVATPFSLEACITVIGVTIIIYTTGGGLWGVLATDVVQFVILSAAVIIIIPLALQEVGGMDNFLSRTPPGFFSPVNEEYSVGFMLAFFIYQVVYIAGNWSYVQRYTSVSSERNARKVAYLFAGLYLVAPFIWMLPPMIYRVINPSLAGTDAEGAYMMLCQKVLPAGLIGLVLSGMIAATASKANTTINTAAIIFAQDIYRDIFFKNTSEKRTILVARLFTVLFGAGTIGLAIMVPAAGGIVNVVLSTAAIAGGSLFAPVIYSLFSKRQTSFSLITISVLSLLVSLFFKVLAPSMLGITLNRTIETTLGVGFPLLLLVGYELYARSQNIVVPYFQEAAENAAYDKVEGQRQNVFGVKVIALSTGFVGLGIAILGGIAQQGEIAMVVGIVIMIIAGLVLLKQRSKRLAAAAMLIILSAGATAQTRYLRGDQDIEFKWRLGYSEYPLPSELNAVKEDALRGAYGWYNGRLWTSAYQNWRGETVQGVQLLFRGGSPYAREVKCTSELVPFDLSGSPVSFLIPFSYTLGSSEMLGFGLNVKGNGEESISCQLKPSQQTGFSGGMFKVNFIGLNFSQPASPKPVVSVSGYMHIVVYPQLVRYNDRMQFSFVSSTRHMDVESALVIGSVYSDMSNVDPYAQMRGTLVDSFHQASSEHLSRLQAWRSATAGYTKSLEGKGRVEVSLASATTERDAGELRVMAYSGNPVKDFQYGPVSSQMLEMAQSVTSALGRRFSLFRYQHHNLPWKLDNPSELDPAELPYLRNWLQLASQSADSVMLDLQISPIVKLYREASQAGHLALPASGIPGAPWSAIRTGYVTTLQYALSVCPNLRIIQMPYELDNMSSTAVHSNAHYKFFQTLYEAVNEVNQKLPLSKHLLVAGLGSNTPNSRWEFINEFLKRYVADRSPAKRLDYITWHTYLFPGSYPSMVKGFAKEWLSLLAKNDLTRIPVIVDEMGLAEPSTIEDLSSLQGASRKEAAMASFTAALQDYYEKESDLFKPVSGAGWHFALLTYGKQNILSPYAKGILLRSKLGSQKLPVLTAPIDNQGYGLHAMATRKGNKIQILLFIASPSIFFSEAKNLDYPIVEIALKDLPKELRAQSFSVTEHYSSPEDSSIVKILNQDRFQTLPLTRGADRYDKIFTAAEVESLQSIPSKTRQVKAEKDVLRLSTGLDAYGMKLIEIEPIVP